MKTILLHGPAGCGKTYNATPLKLHYGARVIVDGFYPETNRMTRFRTDNGPAPKELDGALILTNLPQRVAKKVAKRINADCVAFADAMVEITHA